MVEPADRELLCSIFLMEAWETVAALEDGGAAASRGEVEALRVLAHRLRGAASLHEYPAVAEVAARVEALLDRGAVDGRRRSALRSRSAPSRRRRSHRGNRRQSRAARQSGLMARGAPAQSASP